MKKLLLSLLLVPMTGTVSAVFDTINAYGVIDKENQFGICFDTKFKRGIVEFTKFENSAKYSTTQGYTIDSCEAIGNDPVLVNNDLILKTEKGDFFIPKPHSKEKALFNQKPVTLIRAEDIVAYAAAHPKFKY